MIKKSVSERNELKKLKKENYDDIQKVNFLNKPHLNEPKKYKNPDGIIINLINVYKLFTNGFVINRALNKINLKIKKGSFAVILGKSGSGKTTLMNIMSGLSRASSGITSVSDNNLITLKEGELRKFRKQEASFVFQQYGLVQTLTVYENVKSGAYLSSEKISKNEILKILDLVNIRKQKNSFPKQLSGGQQQRTSIARALIKKPRILFCDEPTGSLDSLSSYNIFKLFKKINKENKTTIIIITHDSRIGQLADHLIEIEDGQITEDKFQTPITEFKQLFV